MAKTSPANPIEIDKNFFLPPNVVDVRYEQDDDSQPYYAANPDITAVDLVLDNPTATTPLPPIDFTVIEQNINIAPDGTTYVDVIIEIDDVQGINKFDVRYTEI